MVKVVKSTVLEAPVEAVWEILRDFNGHDEWHPAVADSEIERGYSSDKVGCVRRFHFGGRLGIARTALDNVRRRHGVLVLPARHPGAASKLRCTCTPRPCD